MHCFMCKGNEKYMNSMQLRWDCALPRDIAYVIIKNTKDLSTFKKLMYVHAEFRKLVIQHPNLRLMYLMAMHRVFYKLKEGDEIKLVEQLNNIEGDYCEKTQRLIDVDRSFINHDYETIRSLYESVHRLFNAWDHRMLTIPPHLYLERVNECSKYVCKDDKVKKKYINCSLIKMVCLLCKKIVCKRHKYQHIDVCYELAKREFPATYGNDVSVEDVMLVRRVVLSKHCDFDTREVNHVKRRQLCTTDRELNGPRLKWNEIENWKLNLQLEGIKYDWKVAQYFKKGSCEQIVVDYIYKFDEGLAYALSKKENRTKEKFIEMLKFFQEHGGDVSICRVLRHGDTDSGTGLKFKIHFGLDSLPESELTSSECITEYDKCLNSKNGYLWKWVFVET